MLEKKVTLSKMVKYVKICFLLFVFDTLFGWWEKVKGKKIRGKIVKGKKVKRKWVESKMIIWLFGWSESGRKDRNIFK
jgi:hypothetical protein